MLVAREQSVIGAARIPDHQPRRVGVSREILGIDLSGAQQFLRQSHHQKTIRTRTDAEPFVRDRRIARAHRIDGYDFRAARLQLSEADLQRIAVMVLCDAEQQKILGMIPVGLPEFPERAADGVHSRRSHVDRTEAAMGRIVGRAELARPPAGQRLGLVAAGIERQALRIGRPDVA